MTDAFRRVTTRVCKQCQETRFSVTGDTISADIARGLSAPSRCPKCRKKNARFLNKVGAGYWPIRRASEVDIQTVGKCGLARLENVDPAQTVRSYSTRPREDLKKKFEILDPPVEALIRNLEDPRGTRVSILVGPTGTGKSVWAPYRILCSRVGQEGRICVTQPRLVTLRSAKGEKSTKTTPGFVASELLGAGEVGAGQEIGVLYKGESSQHDRYTRLLYLTDGILIRYIISGQIGQFSVIFIDEAHEQSSNMELIFALLRYHLPLYPRLRLVIASGTIDVDRFRGFFGNGDPSSVFVAMPERPATLAKISDRWPEEYGRLIPSFSIPETKDDLPEAIAKVARAIATTPSFNSISVPRGDILAFVPTISLVDRTVEQVRALLGNSHDVFPLHAQMKASEVSSFQRSEEAAGKAFEQKKTTPRPRVIVATNYAETSVTISNLRFVIESGFILESCWNPETCSNQYLVRRHSRAGCTQRRGRVGRIQDGEVFRLYTEVQFRDTSVFPENPRPAIARESLEKFLLTAKVAGIADLESFKWMGFDERDAAQISERSRSFASLAKHKIIDSDGDVTSRGVELESIKNGSLDWCVAMSQCDEFGCALEVATFLAFNDVSTELFVEGERGSLAYGRFREGCADDLEFYLRLFSAWEKPRHEVSEDAHERWVSDQGLNHGAFLAIDRGRRDGLKEFLPRTHTDPCERELDLERIHRVRLVLGYNLREWIYVPGERNGERDPVFTPLDPAACPCKSPVLIEHNSACVGELSLTGFVCLARSTIGTRVFASHVVKVDPQLIERLARSSRLGIAHLMRSTLESAGDPIVRGAKMRIQAVPPVPLKPAQFKPGVIYGFERIRFTSGRRDGERNLVLAREVNTKQLVLLSHEGGALEAGARFRAVAQPASGGSVALRVSQYELQREYPDGKVLERRSLRQVRVYQEPGEQTPDAVVFELEPGVTAKVSRPKDSRYLIWWREFLEGGFPKLVVQNKERDFYLRLHFPTPEVRQVFRGFVVGFHEDPRDGYRIGMKVMFQPNTIGMVFARQLTRGYLARFAIGNEVRVSIVTVSQKDLRTIYDLTLV